MNPGRVDVEGTRPDKKEDSRRFWTVTIGVAALLGIIALVFLLTH